MKNLKWILSASIIVLCSCTAPNNSTISSVSTSGAQFNNLSSSLTKHPHFKKKTRAMIKPDGSFEFIPECAGFKTQGKIEGNPCENDTFSGMEKFYLPPEYNKTEAVIVSEYITETPEGEGILKGIMETGSDIWFLSANPRQFSSVRNALGIQADGKGTLKRLNALTESVWARDWAPLIALPGNDYQGEKVDFKMLDTNYYPERQADDSISRQIRNEILNPRSNFINASVKRESLPVYMEGGNIMCNEKNCFLTNKVIEENGIVNNKDDIILSEAELKSEFKKQISQDIWFVSSLPYEPTKHIDMWTKFLNENTLIINYLSDETIKNAVPQDISKFKEIQEFLEIQAAGKEANSLAYLVKKQNPNIKIIRMPMPLPILYPEKEDEEQIEIFRSYTNSLLLNGSVLVPRYVRNEYKDIPYNDNDLIKSYEKEVQELYESAGYKVIWLKSDDLISVGGAVHCVTMQVPVSFSKN